MLFKYGTVNQLKTLGHKLNKLKIVIVNAPKSITDQKARQELVKFVHTDPIDGGHTGKRRMIAKMKLFYIWKNMSKDIAKFVDNCHECKVNKPKRKVIEPQVLTATPQRAFQKVIIDTIGPLAKSENNNAYILTMMCDLTKYLIPVAIPSKEAQIVARAIFFHLVLIHGPVSEIITDLGTEYANQILKELLSLYKIDLKHSTPYHHQTVGSVERNHRVLNEYLRAYMKEITNWEDYVKYFSYCYNTTPHTSFDTKYTPFQLVYGYTPNEIPFLHTDKIDPVYNIDSFAIETKYKLQNAQKLANELLQRAKRQSKALQDANSRPINVKIGDTVMILQENRHKHEALHRGPFHIIDINEPNVTVIDKTSNKTKTVHKNNIRKY